MSRCPSCNSPKPHLHPAVQYEGEVQMCANPFHKRSLPESTRRLLAFIAKNPGYTSDWREAAAIECLAADGYVTHDGRVWLEGASMPPSYTNIRAVSP